jgi:pimeloyl-ACP methyl ester carboxylesterase
MSAAETVTVWPGETWVGEAWVSGCAHAPSLDAELEEHAETTKANGIRVMHNRFQDSDWPGTYSFELMRDDVVEVLDVLNLRHVILVGHSMGGTVAYLIAQAQPGRIARLVIEDTVPPFPRTRALPEQPAGDLPFDWPVVPAIAEQVNDPTRRWWSHLPDISSPTLLIGGGPTSHIPQNLLVEVAQLVPDCTLITINTGHNIHQAAPNQFIDALTTWLASRGPVLLPPGTSQ